MEPPGAMLVPPDPVAIPVRPADGHKGTHGRVAVVAGSMTFTGAPYLTGTAALRGGAGQVRLLVGRSIHPVLATKCIEVEVDPLPEVAPGVLGTDSYPEIARVLAESATVAVVGPGLGRHPATVRLVPQLMGTGLPMVLDADALNALSDQQDLLPGLGVGMPARVITPHPGEMSRLTGRTIAAVQADRESIALDAAQRWGVVVVLKGARTVVASPEGRCTVDPHAVPALATAGTGDVLAGLIAAMLAQGSDAFTAAVTGVFVQAAAGRRVAGDLRSGVLASELLPAIPQVMQALRRMGR